MDCKTCREQMSLHLDNMPDRDENGFRHHLETCEECSILYERMASTREHLANMPEEELPEGFHDRWMMAAKAQKTAQAKHNLKWVRIAAPVAAAMVVVVIGWQVFFNGVSLTPPAAPAPMPNAKYAAQDTSGESVGMGQMAPAATEAPAATAAPTAAATMEAPGAELNITALSPEPSAADLRDTAVLITVVNKPGALQSLEKLLDKINVPYDPVKMDSGMKISFTIGPEKYEDLQKWFNDFGVRIEDADARTSDGQGPRDFEITFN